MMVRLSPEEQRRLREVANRTIAKAKAKSPRSILQWERQYRHEGGNYVAWCGATLYRVRAEPSTTARWTLEVGGTSQGHFSTKALAVARAEKLAREELRRR